MTRTVDLDGWAPTKGGDGGTPARPNAQAAANAVRVLCGASIRRPSKKLRNDRPWLVYIAGCEITVDPSDRAHAKYEGRSGVPPTLLMLRPAHEMPADESLPRVYPSSAMVGRPHARVSIDSMFDGAYEAAAPFEAAGINLGWGGGGASALRAGDLRGCGLRYLSRDATRQRTRQALDHDERALLRQAQAMLDEAEARERERADADAASLGRGGSERGGGSPSP